jgi:hypothetical protein
MAGVNLELEPIIFERNNLERACPLEAGKLM